MIKLMTYHTDSGAVRNALVKEGHKWLQVLMIDAGSNSGLSVVKVPRSDLRYMKPLMRGKNEYPISRALGSFRRMIKSHGATKTAKRFVKEVAREQKAIKDSAGEASTATSGDT